MRFKSTTRRAGFAAVAIIGYALLLSNTQAGQFRFPVGLTYSSGAQKVMDEIKDNYFVDSDFVLPVGLSLNPYYEFDNGLAIGATVGPGCVVVVDQTTYYGYYSTSDTRVSYIVPVGGYVRYTLFRDKAISPYVRGGVIYNIAGGDDISSGDVGGFGAVGVEFWRNKAVGLGIEAGYSTSTVTIKPSQFFSNGERSVDYGEFTLSVMAVF